MAVELVRPVVSPSRLFSFSSKASSEYPSSPSLGACSDTSIVEVAGVAPGAGAGASMSAIAASAAATAAATAAEAASVWAAADGGGALALIFFLRVTLTFLPDSPTMSYDARAAQPLPFALPLPSAAAALGLPAGLLLVVVPLLAPAEPPARGDVAAMGENGPVRTAAPGLAPRPPATDAAAVCPRSSLAALPSLAPAKLRLKPRSRCSVTLSFFDLAARAFLSRFRSSSIRMYSTCLSVLESRSRSSEAPLPLPPPPPPREE